MLKKVALFILLSIAVNNLSAQIYLGKKSEISFFSTSPVEDISAINYATKPILNTNTGEIQIRVSIKAFKFEKPLMEEHFNETYLESETYPYAFLKGKINEKIDFSKDGEYNVTVTGEFEIHGVKQQRTFEGSILIKGNEIKITSEFSVILEDHKIDVPALQKLAISETIKVKINATLVPYKK